MATKKATEAKKQKRRKTGKASKDKGKRGEREIANLLKEAGFKNAHRSAQCKGNTGDAADVEGLPGIHIEVKRVEKLNLKKHTSKPSMIPKKTVIMIFRQSFTARLVSHGWSH